MSRLLTASQCARLKDRTQLQGICEALQFVVFVTSIAQHLVNFGSILHEQVWWRYPERRRPAIWTDVSILEYNVSDK
jgi:hypothetical protein